MKTFQELLTISGQLSEELKSIEAWFKNSRAELCSLFTGSRFSEETREKQKAYHDQEQEKQERKNKIEIMLRILRDNMRVAYFNETMPTILDVLRKYENKPFGPKTEKAINDELLQRCNIKITIHAEPDYRSDELKISTWPGSPACRFGYGDLTILTNYDATKTGGNKDQKRPMLGGTTGNRIVTHPLEAYRLYNCKNYVEGYEDRAKDILEQFKALQEQQKQFEAGMDDLNKVLPSGIDYLSHQSMRWYLT